MSEWFTAYAAESLAQILGVPADTSQTSSLRDLYIFQGEFCPAPCFAVPLLAVSATRAHSPHPFTIHRLEIVTPACATDQGRTVPLAHSRNFHRLRPPSPPR